jgi:DNA-binding NtrC family response regulator
MEKRILIIEDNEVARAILKRQLNFPLCRTDTAACGRQAQQLAETYTYNVIITDFHLPDIRDTELIVKLKRIQPDTPLLVISGAPLEEDYELSRLGVYSFFKKPILLEPFRKTVEELLTAS